MIYLNELCGKIGIPKEYFRMTEKNFIHSIKEIYESRKLIGNLAKNDFKKKFAGSYLGTIWAFIQPVVTVFVYWFVFGIVMQYSRGPSEYPYVLWLIAGLVPWFFFQDALTGGTNALLEYNYLVKKVVFQINVLPIVKILAAIFVHAFFVVIMLIISAGYGRFPDLYTLQIVYYTFCMFVMALGISYATSAIVIFFRDLNPMINIMFQVGVWMTPIMWDFSLFAGTMAKYPWLVKVFKLNPMYYIVYGYREAILQKVWFWERPVLTAYFWIFTILMFVIGTRTFKKLKPHFADVL